MYESPINIIYGEMQMSLENEVFKAVQNVHVEVDRDELIKALQYDRDQYEKGFADGHAEAQRWIPCSERLPEDDGDAYLVTDYCKQINRKRIHISYCYMNRDGFWSDVPMGYSVIAWMPLPEPYREDGDNDG